MGVIVRERPKGSGIWYIYINNKGKRKSKKIGKKKAVAVEVAEKIKAKLILGEFNLQEVNDNGPTFKTLAKKWLAMPNDWKDSTQETYMNNLEKHVLPIFGKQYINHITRKDLKLFFDGLFADGLKLNTLKLIRASFRGVFSYAVESELIESNPFNDLRLNYKKNVVEINPLSENEADQLLEQAKIFLGGKYYPPILLALRTGLRIGEIQALKWSDIDFEYRQIEVKRSWRKGRFSRTKNKKRRRVDMSFHLAETLKDHRIQQKRLALKTGMPFSDLVFTGVRNEILNRITFKNALDRCMEAGKMRKIRTHDLRHSYATIRLMRGHNVGDVSYQLGHSSIKITYDVYVHWIPGKFKNEVDDLDFHQPSATYTQPSKVID